MSTFPGLALLVIKSLLGVISQILDQVAALKKQIAAFQERLAELRNQIASLRAGLHPDPPPGPSPGGSLLQRPTPRPSQTARTQTRPGTVLVPRSSRPRLGHRASRGGWSDGAGLSLVRSAVGGGRCRVGLNHRDPTPPATDRAVLSGPCVSVPVVRPAGAHLHPDLAPDQYGATPIGWVRG